MTSLPAPDGPTPIAFDLESGRATVAATLGDRLITAIAIGAYSPGERLPPEREFAKSLNVSRVTLRQALATVAATGLLEVRRGRGGGAYVARTSWEEVAPEVAKRTLEVELPKLTELFDYRCLVEGMIARAAARRRTSTDIESLRVAAEAFASADTMIEARALDRQLHHLIIAAAGNPHLLALSAQLTAAATLGFGSEPYEPEFFVRATHEHGDLVAHVVAGDVEAAGRCAEEHFALTMESMWKSLERAATRVGPVGSRPG